jgi:hypothetical protein
MAVKQCRCRIGHFTRDDKTDIIELKCPYDMQLDRDWYLDLIKKLMVAKKEEKDAE